MALSAMPGRRTADTFGVSQEVRRFVNLFEELSSAMTSRRNLGPVVLGALSLPLAQPAVAAPEPLVVTQLPDPDPSYAPPPPEPKQKVHRPRRNADENPPLEEAMENLGRVAGQLAHIEGQKIRARERPKP